MTWKNGRSRTSSPEWRRLRQWAKVNLDFACAYNPGHEGPFHLDHIVSVKQGGTDAPNNLQWLCVPCHKAKTATEAAWARRPYRRRGGPPIGKRD